VQLDTTHHGFSVEKLIGKWNVMSYGIFEITDSLPANSKTYYRNENILKDQKDAAGHIVFTDKRYKLEFENIKELPNKKKRYKIVDGKFLATKRINKFCGSTIIGVTNEGYLIIDDHTFKTLAHIGKHLVVKTTIRRIILKKAE
jgi:hypothetical protein